VTLRQARVISRADAALAKPRALGPGLGSALPALGRGSILTKAVADAFSVRLAYVPFRSGPELTSALDRIRAADADAMIVFPDPLGPATIVVLPRQKP